jgi:hypothetical protein
MPIQIPHDLSDKATVMAVLAQLNLLKTAATSFGLKEITVALKWARVPADQHFKLIEAMGKHNLFWKISPGMRRHLKNDPGTHAGAAPADDVSARWKHMTQDSLTAAVIDRNGLAAVLMYLRVLPPPADDAPLAIPDRKFTEAEIDKALTAQGVQPLDGQRLKILLRWNDLL